MCGAQVRVAAGADPYRHAQQARQVARDSRADTARCVVDDEHLPDAAPRHSHAVIVARQCADARNREQRAHHRLSRRPDPVHEPSSLQALDSTGIANRPTANPTATTGASGSGTTSTTAASARCGRADGE